MNLVTRVRESRINFHNKALEVYLLDYLTSPMNGYYMILLSKESLHLWKHRFDLILLGEAKWYLGMRITQNQDFISLDQDQYVKNTISRFEKSFKHPFKKKVSQLDFQFLLCQQRKTAPLLMNKLRKQRIDLVI